LIPVFAIAFFFSIIGVGINELAVTKGRAGFNAIIDSSVENILIGQLKDKGQFVTRNNQITILVKGVDDQNRLIEPRIISKKESVTISARTAQISINFDEDLLTVTLNDYRVAGDIISLVGGNETFSIPLSEIIPSGNSNKASNLGLPDVSKERKNTIEQIAGQRRIIAAHRTFAACMGSVDDWLTPQIVEARAEIGRLQKQYHRLSAEPPRRWASGFSCFFFVWLGAPLAIWMRKSDFFASFFACFVPILLLYYPLLTFGVNQAKSGALPPMCVWTANVGIGLIGLWFLRQIHRY
jgi:lipopolysaccharide export system permease protein